MRVGADQAGRRVALISSSYDPYPGGVEEHTRRLAASLRSRGDAVEVWTVDRGEHLGTRNLDGITVRYLPTPLPARNARSLFSFAVRAPGSALRWMDAARRFRPDVLHVHCFGPNGVYTLGLRALSGPSLVVSSHGETFADDHAVFDSSRLVPWAMRRALRTADAVTGCSGAVLADLRRRFPGVDLEAAIVVPNGVDIAEAGLPTQGRPEPVGIFALGRLQRVKGFDLLLEAAARLPHGDDGTPGGWRLRIGGDGPERDRLERLARDLGLEDRVTFLGRLDRTDVVREMARAGVVVVPSRMEAFGITVLEAWRAGAAVLATTRGGPPEFVSHGETGLLADPLDTESFAEALESLVRDPVLRAALGKSGRERVHADFTWARVADRYDAVYRALRSDDRPRRRRRSSAG